MNPLAAEPPTCGKKLSVKLMIEVVGTYAEEPPPLRSVAIFWYVEIDWVSHIIGGELFTKIYVEGLFAVVPFVSSGQPS